MDPDIDQIRAEMEGLKSGNRKKYIRPEVVYLRPQLNIYKGVDVVEWSGALDVRLSEWCCSVSMVCVQIPSREEQKFDSSKI